MKTILKWRDAEKKRPKKSGYYLVVTTTGRITYLSYSFDHDAFNVRDDDKTSSGQIYVLLWAKVKAPKVLPL